MWPCHPTKKQALAVLSAALLATTQAKAEPSIFDGWECVPFARQMSGIQLFGDAWTWWSQAFGRYAEGFLPRRGAVLVFKPTEVMKFAMWLWSARSSATASSWSRMPTGRGSAAPAVRPNRT